MKRHARGGHGIVMITNGHASSSPRPATCRLSSQVWRASSGHLLVRPHINGQESGYVVLDTGGVLPVLLCRIRFNKSGHMSGHLWPMSEAGVPASGPAAWVSHPRSHCFVVGCYFKL
jgi:hypothetical protein